MVSKSSLESLLHTLVNTTEVEKGAVLCSLLKALRESCGLFKRSSISEYQDCAKNAQEILDSILTDSITIDDEVWDDEFAESSSSIDSEETIMATRPKIQVPAAEQSKPTTQILTLNGEWNKNVPSWLKLPDVNPEDSQSVIQFVKAVSAMRSNILSNAFDDQSKVVANLKKFWEKSNDFLQKAGYKITPSSFEDTSNPNGRLIYTCRTRTTEPEAEVIMPGIRHKDEIISDAIWLMGLAPEAEFPAGHSKASLSSHWRGIFGEVDLLSAYIEIQTNAFSAVEGVNKNKVETLDESRNDLIPELSRRADVLYSSIQKKEKDEESLYLLATNYWRIEEFFWSIFHDDERPSGCSYFDRLRNRIQGWRATLRRILKFHIRDFSCGSDSLASVNKYIGNIILKQKKNTPAGMVTRELRPAIMVKDQGANRLLKGRVIST